MSTDNQELKSGDLVEILIPELAKGVTGTLMRACSNDCVVIAIDRKPVMQMRINISRHLVRKVETPARIEVPDVNIFDNSVAEVDVYKDEETGMQHFFSRNNCVPHATFDPQYRDVVIEDSFPLINPEDLKDFVHLMKVVEATVDENSGDSKRSGSESEIGTWTELSAGGFGL